MEENKNVEIPAKFAAIVKQIEEMSVLDLNELVKLFEVKFGVSAAAVAVAGPAAGAAAADEKTDFTAILTSDGGAKIGIMKVVKESLGLGLKEAKDLVDNLPATLKEGMKKEDADALKKAIEDAGGKVELK
ncbi:MAG: ribosomal protein [Patescibacteria group bacterium]|nr:ribosomal protein [Patescibacteria group bacterium]